MRLPHVALTAVLVLVLAPAAALADPVYDLAIQDVTVVTPDRPVPIEDVDVYVIQGRIVRMDVGSDERPEARTRIEGRGLFLTPGFIDSHVHVGSLPGPSPRRAREIPGMLEELRRTVPRAYLYFGFTTLIDLDLSPSTRTWFEAQSLRPRLFGCGRGIRTIDGYGMNFVEPDERFEVFPNFVIQAGEPVPTGVDASLHSPEAAVRQAVEQDAVCVKTYHETGFSGVFDLDAPRPETTRAIVEAAHDAGLPVVLHATSVEAYEAGLDAGVDVIGHGLWHWEGDLFSTIPPRVHAAIEGLARDGVAVQPTLRVVEGEAAVVSGDARNDPRLGEILGPLMREWAETEDADWARRELLELYGQVAHAHDLDDLAAIEIFVRRARATLAEMADRDVVLIFGSDTPAAPGLANVPGLNGWREIMAWNEAGVPLDVLFRALTQAPAEAFGLADRLGAVAVGMRADLLLLEADPRRDIGAYDRIQTVIMDGRPVLRDELSSDP